MSSELLVLAVLFIPLMPTSAVGRRSKRER